MMAANVTSDDVLADCLKHVIDSRVKIKVDDADDSNRIKISDDVLADCSVQIIVDNVEIKSEDDDCDGISMDRIGVNLDIKCRGCFAEEPEMHYLFTAIDQKLSLADILEDTTSYIAKEDDGCPSYLCTKCTTCLVDFFNFKIQYQKMDLYIQTLLCKTNVVSLEVYSDEASGSDFETASSDDIKTVQDNLILFCESCLKTFEDRDLFDTHMAKQHGKNPFEKYAMFRSHYQQSKKAKIEARKKLKYIKADREEMEMLEMPGRLCRFCRKKFPEDEFKTHWDLHKKHICEHCGHKCIKKSDLDVHIQSVHIDERNYKCDVCSKSFKTKQLLNRHLIVHTNPRSFICHHCGNRFNDRTTLNTHIQLKHIKSRDFICSICGLAFPLKSTLEKHILRHNKSRPPKFFCTICNAGFKDKSSLKRHDVIKHSEDYEKPQCHVCKKSYSSKTRLKCHIEKHHNSLKTIEGNGNVQCQFCKKKYSSDATLEYHIEKHHVVRKMKAENSFEEIFLEARNEDSNNSCDNIVTEELSDVQMVSSEYVYPAEIEQYMVKSDHPNETDEFDSDY